MIDFNLEGKKGEYNQKVKKIYLQIFMRVNDR